MNKFKVSNRILNVKMEILFMTNINRAKYKNFIDILNKQISLKKINSFDDFRSSLLQIKEKFENEFNKLDKSTFNDLKSDFVINCNYSLYIDRIKELENEFEFIGCSTFIEGVDWC